MDSKQPKKIPGMWRFPTDPDRCCIYRVPSSLRDINPEAYTPQLVLIGPLHLSLKSQALKSLDLGDDITYTKSMGYLNMEEHKKIYLSGFAARVEGEYTIDGFKRMIKKDEEIIRTSYQESIAWIQSQEFVEMVLHDSVFIIEFILRATNIGPQKTGDPLIDGNLASTVNADLILLENQLPYFILEKLFDPIVPRMCQYQTFRELIIAHFGSGDCLIDTDKDVDLLVEKGIIRNWIGQPALVARMVNKLGLGIIEVGSYYSEIAVKVNKHYANRFHRSYALLKRVYFGNLWTGTATVAATLLLVMTLIQTVASIIQVMQSSP
ncbi:hypothetical protein Bca52824_080245 [Brassica carinata]|uniref:Uncharacterized protein n=1 Tax=Brassica carinata TaxID=52824 RepID=A0A8X7PZJ0_BRACI|nr:hypothetical protein Bca52824_080245 [Brassica carinata]